MATLIDTSVLLAYVNSRDANHAKAYQAIRPLTRKDRIVPVSVLVELFYMSTVRLNYAQAVQIYGKTRGIPNRVDNRMGHGTDAGYHDTVSISGL